MNKQMRVWDTTGDNEFTFTPYTYTRKDYAFDMCVMDPLHWLACNMYAIGNADRSAIIADSYIRFADIIPLACIIAEELAISIIPTLGHDITLSEMDIQYVECMDTDLWIYEEITTGIMFAIDMDEGAMFYRDTIREMETTFPHGILVNQ